MTPVHERRAPPGVGHVTVRALCEVAEEYGVGGIVIGLPLNMDGTEGQQAAWVRDYVSELGTEIAVPVALWDERLTTEEAKDILRAQGKPPARDWIDAVAAAVILQSYLDAQA